MRSKGISYSLALLLSAGVVSLSGCGGGDGDSARVAQTVDASKNGVVEAAIAPTDGYVHINGKLQFDLIGKDKDGKETNLNTKATWTLSDKTLGNVKDGLFTASGVMASNLMLTASYAGITKEQAITLSDANLTSIDISHSDGFVDVCKNTPVVAKASFSDGKDYDYPLTWAVDSASAPLANFPDATKPNLSTQKSGEIKISATGKDNAGNTITSNELPLSISASLIKLTPASNKDLRMRQGQTATVKVTADYQNGSSADITANASLESDNTGALTVNKTTGLITAGTGSQSGIEVNISATCDTTTETLKLTILKPEIATMQIVGPNSETATESLSVSVSGGSIKPRVKVSYIDTSVPAEIYSANDIEWAIDDAQSADYDESLISINSTTGELKIDEDLNLVQSLALTITARIKNSTNGTATGSNSLELKDEIQITVNR